MITIAEAIEPPVNVAQTNATLWGIVGILVVLFLVFGIALQAKKLFGRRPPFDEELKEQKKRLQAQIHAVERRLDGRINNLEERYEEMQLDRQRKWEELRNEYHELRETLQFIRGKFEAQEKGKA